MSINNLYTSYTPTARVVGSLLFLCMASTESDTRRPSVAAATTTSAVVAALTAAAVPKPNRSIPTKYSHT